MPITVVSDRPKTEQEEMEQWGPLFSPTCDMGERLCSYWGALVGGGDGKGEDGDEGS